MDQSIEIIGEVRAVTDCIVLDTSSSESRMQIMNPEIIDDIQEVSMMMTRDSLHRWYLCS